MSSSLSVYRISEVIARYAGKLSCTYFRSWQYAYFRVAKHGRPTAVSCLITEKQTLPLTYSSTKEVSWAHKFILQKWLRKSVALKSKVICNVIFVYFKTGRMERRSVFPVKTQFGNNYITIILSCVCVLESIYGLIDLDRQRE